MPIVVADLQATLSVDTSRLKTGLEQAKQAFNEMGGATGTAAQGLRQIAAFDREVEQETARLTALLSGQSKATADLAARYTELRPAEIAHLAALKEQVAAELAASTAIEKTGTTLEKTTISLRQFGTAASTAGRALTAGLTGPLLAIGGFALKSSLDIAHAMDTIRQQTGATGPALQGLEASFKRVSTEVPQSFGEVAKAIALVSQRTHETGPPLDALAKTELNLARVTGTDLGQNITRATQLFHQYGIGVQEQVPFLDLLFRAHQQTGIGMAQLQDAMLRFAPSLKALGLGAADAAALLGTMESRGGNLQKITQGLTQVMTKWAKEGITDAHTAMGNLINALQKAPDAMHAVKIASEAGFGGRSGLDFVNIVRSSGLEFDKLTGKLVAGGDTINKAADQTLHLNDSVAKLQKAMELALQPLGDLVGQKLMALADQAKAATPEVKKLVDAFSHQGEAPKNIELTLAGIVAGVPPVLFGIGKIALAWEALTTTVTAGAAVVAGFFSAAVFAVALPIDALIAVGFAIAALLTNWHGARDDWIAGWNIIADTAKNVAEAIPRFFSNVWSSIEQGFGGLGDRLRTDWSTLGRDAGSAFGNAFNAAAYRVQEQAKQQLVQAQPGSNLQEAFSDIVPIPLAGPPKGEPRPKSSGGFHGHGAPPNTKAMTAEQQKQQRLMGEIASKQEELNVLKAGESNILGQVVARYGTLNPAEERHLANILQQIKGIEKATTGHEAYRKKLAEVNAQIAAVQAGDKARTAVPAEQFPGTSAKERATLQQRERDLAAAQAAQTKQIALGREINAFIDQQTAKHIALSGATQHTMSAVEALARAEQLEAKAIAANDVPQTIAAERAVSLAKANLQAEESIQRKAEALKMAQAAEGQEAAAVNKVIDGLAALAAKHEEVRGATVADVDADKVYQESLKTDIGLLQNFALAAIVVAQNDADFLSRQKELTKEFDDTNREWQQAAHLEDAEIQRHAELTGSTKALAQVQIALGKALAEGDDALALWLSSIGDAVKANDALTAAHKEGIKAQSEFNKGINQVANALEGQFTKAFENVSKGGFRNFFSNMLTGLDQLLTQMAAKILAANLTNLFFGSPNDQGQRAGGVLGSVTGAIGGAAQSSGGQGGMGGLLTGLVGGVLGGIFGGGGTADAGTGGFGIGPSTFTGADLAGFASGGDIRPGQAAWVGEKGPELLMPTQGAHVMSNAQSRQAMAGPTIHMTINTPDAPSFRKAQGNIMNDLSRSAKLWDTRNNSQDGT